MWRVLIVALAGLACGFAAANWLSKPSRSISAISPYQPLSPAYIGDAECARCHQDQAALHRESGHSQTFIQDDLPGRFAAILDQKIPDPARPGHFQFSRAPSQSDRLTVTYSEAGTSKSLPVQFAIGSGTHATTFLTLIDDPQGEPAAVEHRLSLFDQNRRFDLTPSQGGPPTDNPLDCFGRIKRGRDVVRCVECHSTTGHVQGAAIRDLRPNVGCERCHGPGREHVLAVSLKQPNAAIKFAPSSAAAVDEINMCGQCHRLPEAMNTLPDPDDEKLARFQPVGLLQSACFRRSEGKLRCSTCHDPHQTVVREQAPYDARCQECHSRNDGGSRQCPVSNQGSCIGCHMPTIEVHPGIRFHDHWIRRR